jgi:hypothetical protein
VGGWRVDEVGGVWRRLNFNLVLLGRGLVVVKRGWRFLKIVSPDGGSWYVIVVLLGFWLIVIVRGERRWLVVNNIGVSGFVVVVKLSGWHFVVVSPDSSFRLIRSIALGFNIVVVVGNIRRGEAFGNVGLKLWHIGVEGLFGLVVVVGPGNWSGLVAHILLEGGFVVGVAHVWRRNGFVGVNIS